ncbi:C4-dicarboxylate ABC transporter, partial [Candidatus Entotheonella serta]
MRKTIMGLLVLALLTASQTSSARTQIKIATLAPQNTGCAKQLRAASKEIKERTQNRVHLKFYWGGAQGTEAKVLQ